MEKEHEILFIKGLRRKKLRFGVLPDSNNFQGMRLLQHTLKFLNLASESLFHSNATRHLITGIKYGTVIAFAKHSTYMAVSGVGVLVYQEHCQLTRLHGLVPQLFGMPILQKLCFLKRPYPLNSLFQEKSSHLRK